METTNIIAILLFIIPGILAEKISHKMDFPSGRKRNDFGEIINGIALSFPILFVAAFILHIIYGFKSFDEYIDAMNQIDDLFIIILITLFVTILSGVITGISCGRMNKIINFIREKLLHKMKIDGNTCWRRFLLDKNESKYLEVIKDGKHYKGFSGPYSLPDEGKEIILLTPVELQNCKEYNEDKLFKRVKSTYIDLEKNIVVKDYDMTDYYKWCDKIENANKTDN